MRTGFAGLNGANDNGRLFVEAWVVLEMHFISRPHLIEDAKAALAAALDELQVQGDFDPGVLKDRACRQVQLMYGPAPALGDERYDIPLLRRVS